MTEDTKPDGGRGFARFALLRSDTWSLLAGVFIIVVLFSIFAFRLPPVHDEATNHFPLAGQFMHSFPVFSDTYYSAYTPLPYVIVGALMNVLGEHIWVARLYNLALGLLGLVGFRVLLKQLNATNSGWALLVLALSPYYLRNCVLFYMGNNAIVLSIWGLAAYLQAQRMWQLVLAASLLGLASLSSQYALAIVAGIWMAELFKLFTDRERPAVKKPGRLLRLAVLALLQTPTLGVFVGWGGLTHPIYRHHALIFSPAHVTGTLVVIGFAFVFLLMPRLRTFGALGLVLVGATMILFAGALPDASIDQGPTSFPGLAVRILGTVSRRAGLDSPLLMLPFAALGVVLLALLREKRTSAPLALRLAIVLTSIALMFSREVSESNVTTVFPFILAFLAVGTPPLISRLAMVAQSTLLGIGYVLYLVLFKFAHWP